MHTAHLTHEDPTKTTDTPPPLAAGSFYKLAVTTSIQLDEAASDWGTLALCASIPLFAAAIAPYRAAFGSTSETLTTYFQTAGPPQDLSPYVKWVSPQHQSRGHFYQDDFVVRFNRPYVRRLYPDPDTAAGPGDFPHAIEALLRDAEGRVTRGFFHNWTTAAAASLFPDEGRFLEAAGGSPAPFAAPPPDDILEIRRSMLIRKGADLGARNWRMIPLEAPTAGSPKWQRLADGSVRVLAAGNQGGSLFLVHGHDWRDCRFECLIQPLAPGHRGAVGAVIGFAAVAAHYQVRILSGPTPKIQLARVRDGRETILDERLLHGFGFSLGGGLVPAVNASPVRLSIWTQRRSDGLAIQATAGGVRLAALDAFPPAGGSQLGFFARDIDAQFSKLTVTAPRQELAPGARYTLILTGGEGGRTRLCDDFSGAGLGDHWVAEAPSWTAGDGLRASHPGASITLRDSLEDCELVTTLEMAAGDAVRLQLRTPDAARQAGNTTFYELLIQKTDTGCDLTATAATGQRGITQPVGFGRAELGSARRFPLRVRLIGDLLRVWVFERLLVAASLAAYTLEVPSVRPAFPGRSSVFGHGELMPPIGAPTRRVTIPLAWSGAVKWVIAAGAPVIRAVDLRQPTLLQVDFTTSRHGSFAELFERAAAAPEALVAAQYGFEPYAAAMAALVHSQRVVADARIALLATQAQFAVKRAEREALESAKQRAVRASADHDALLTGLLSHFGAAYKAAPAAVRLQRLETSDGQWLGYLLRSPETLDPELIGLPASAPFGSIGRTRFSLSPGNNGAPVPTGWITSGDATALIVYQRSGSTPPINTTPNAQLAPAALIKRAYTLKVDHIRHHRDDLADIDHLYDRPYVLSRSSHEPEFVSGIALSNGDQP
ncbi:MAG: hypothetical protein R6X05_03790 [Desulfobacterales bacterium]